MGRKATTGKYKTRDELVQNVHFFYHHTDQNQAQVARTTGVSDATVANILRKQKPKM
jgi:DNA-binding transcriptional regulator LsrR (DeoR family)